MTEDNDLTQFLGIKNRKTVLEFSRYVVVPIPYEQTTSYMCGTKYAPSAVLEASSQIELFDEEVNKETWKLGICTLPAINCNGSVKRVFPRIKSKAEQLLKYKAIPFFIGGEHSITQAIIPPFIDKYKNLSILHFDAHADLRKSYQGSTHNHACALYPASKKCRLVQTGIRSIAPEEKHLINKGNIRTFLAHKNRNTVDIIKKVVKALTETVYITIDVDGFDPSVIPGTGTPQPGGFKWYEALDLFRAVCINKTIVGVDITEVRPEKNSIVSEFTAAKLIYRLMGYIAKYK